MATHLIIRTFNEQHKGTISEDKSTLTTLQRTYKWDTDRHAEVAFCHTKGTLFFCHFDPIRRANFRLRLSPSTADLKSNPETGYTAPDFFGDLRIFDENRNTWKECLAIKAYILDPDSEEEEEEELELYNTKEDAEAHSTHIIWTHPDVDDAFLEFAELHQ